MNSDRVPRLASRVSTRLLSVFGWHVIYSPSPKSKGVVIVYPHTSNWDFILGILARSVIGLRMHWVGKHTLFSWPFESIMRALGGVPVDRAQTQGLVEQLKKEFDRYEVFFIVLTPEGTRKYTQHWRSGFYHIAHGLQLPIGLARFDYAKREVTLTDWYQPTGDVERDLDHIRAVYSDTRGKHPELAGPVRFRDKE